MTQYLKCTKCSYKVNWPYPIVSFEDVTFHGVGFPDKDKVQVQVAEHGTDHGFNFLDTAYWPDASPCFVVIEE